MVAETKNHKSIYSYLLYNKGMSYLVLSVGKKTNDEAYKQAWMKTTEIVLPLMSHIQLCIENEMRIILGV